MPKNGEIIHGCRSLSADGPPFVSMGFQPDIKIALTQEDLFVGRDSVLEKAVAIVEERD